MVVPGAAKAQEGISRKQQERIQAKKAKDEKKAKAIAREWTKLYATGK